MCTGIGRSPPTPPNTNMSQLESEHVSSQQIPNETDTQSQLNPDQEMDTQS